MFLSRLSFDFLTHLFIENSILILFFGVIYYYYKDISGGIESMSYASRSLDRRQKKILKHFFPFYNKLSPRLQRLFEQKLLFFFYMKKYEGAEGIEVHDRMKLFLSAYAAQVSLGFRSYRFSYVSKVRIYPVQFYSVKRKGYVCWDLDEEGTLHLSWKDFFEQLKKEVVLPIGLEIMAYAIKKDKNGIKDEIYRTRSLVYHSSVLKPAVPESSLFKETELQTKEDFLEACIKHYFSHPLELKNSHPDLFRKIDALLYSQIRFN